MSGTRSSSTSVLNGNSHRASPPRVPLRNSPTVSFYGVTPIGGRRERRRCDDRTADRIAAALALIRQTDEHWHGLAVWLSRSGMDRDAELLDRLAARAEQQGVGSGYVRKVVTRA